MSNNPFEVSNQWYLEAADFLGVFMKGCSRYPAWKVAEMYLGATEKGKELLAGRLYPFDARKGDGCVYMS